MVLISAMALVFCFQLGTQFGRTGDEAAASQLEQKMQAMDEHNRQEAAAQPDAGADHAAMSSVDRTPVAP